jgi:hypothetical protein
MLLGAAGKAALFFNLKFNTQSSISQLLKATFRFKIHYSYQVAISIDQGRDEKVKKLLKSYVSRRKLTFLNLLDPKSEVAVQYGVRGIPMTFFINSRRIVVAYATG